jgi:hypothetical protein
VSTLQCPATLLLAVPGTEIYAAGLRITHTWSEDEAPGILSDDVGTIREALSEIADQTPGETTLVLALDARLRAALPHLARLEVDATALGDASVLELVIDADDWVLRTSD